MAHGLETNTASSVVEWLRDGQWTVYQEVLSGGDRCDIVAVQGRLLWAVEVKQTLSLHLLEQALRWVGHANMVSVAVPIRRRDGGARRIFRDYGIGILCVGRNEMELERPRLLRRVSDNLRSELREEQKTFAPAGTAEGSYWSPFKATCRALRECVEMHSGLTMADAVKRIGHHYSSNSSARTSLAKWIFDGKVPGVRLVQEGGATKLYADKAALAAEWRR